MSGESMRVFTIYEPARSLLVVDRNGRNCEGAEFRRKLVFLGLMRLLEKQEQTRASMGGSHRHLSTSPASFPLVAGLGRCARMIIGRVLRRRIKGSLEGVEKRRSRDHRQDIGTR